MQFSKKIPTRLLSIINCIEKPQSTIIDVGCDHCYTSIFSFIYKNIKFAYNIDNKKGPLVSGIENLKKYGFFDKTSNILSDGLSNLDIKDKIDYCIISGLGGNTIFEILNNKSKDLKIDTYIICCNDHPQKIEEFIKENNYIIKKQDIIKIKNKNKENLFYLYSFTQ